MEGTQDRVRDKEIPNSPHTTVALLLSTMPVDVVTWYIQLVLQDIQVYIITCTGYVHVCVAQQPQDDKTHHSQFLMD